MQWENLPPEFNERGPQAVIDWALAPEHADLFIGCEPRRDWLSFAATPFLGLLGCNSVTQHDAHLSVQAGFVSRELSVLWRPHEDWQLTERRAMFFTHFFAATRKS